MSLAPLAAFPPWAQVSVEHKDKALLCGAGIQGTCSQKWKRAAFPLSVTSPPSTGHQTPSNLGRWEEL